MSILYLLLLSTVAGLGGHQTRPVLKRDFHADWFPISCYVVGMVTIGPFLCAMYLALGGKKEELGRIIAAFCIAALGVGAGVVTGHYLQPDEEEE